MDEKMADAQPDADVMDVEVRARLDSLHEKLQQAKALHSINPSQAEILYKSIIDEGGIDCAGRSCLNIFDGAVAFRLGWRGIQQVEGTGHLQAWRIVRRIEVQRS
jgi:hypothetical protein